MGKFNSMIARLPWPVRLVIALLAIYLMLRLAVWRMVDEMTDAASEVMDVEYGGSYFNWRGHFGVKDVQVTLYDGEGNPRADYAMERVVIRPSSWLYLLRSAFSPSKYLPDEIGVTLVGLRNVKDNESTPGNYTNLPYDAMGCTDFLLTRREIQAMGLAELRRDLHVQIDRRDLQTVDVEYALETAGAGKLAVSSQVEMDWPVRTRNLIAELGEAPMRSASLTFTDLGFIDARNAACARKHGMQPVAFQAYHMQEVRRRLSEENLSYGEAALQQYGTFAGKGGELAIRSAGPMRLTFGEFMGMSTLQKMQAVPLKIAAGDAHASEMHVTWGGPGPNSRSRATAGTVAAPVASSVPTATTVASRPAAAAATLPAAGSEVPWSQAAILVGQHVDVSTRMGTHRRGVVRSYVPQAMSLQVDEDEGGFSLTLYADDVATLRYTPGDTARTEGVD